LALPGLDYVKMDWCHEPSGFTAQEVRSSLRVSENDCFSFFFVLLSPSSNSLHSLSFQLYTNMSQALNKTGRPIFFSICEWGRYDPWTWCVSL
jgi:hypothetical protein